jgi:Protein of unknown function (DUF3300)
MAMKRLNGAAVVVALVSGVLLCGVTLLRPPSQEPSPPPPQNEQNQQAYEMENPQRLQQLVAPIALYPDSLVASALAASRFPDQLAAANEWLASRRNLPPDQIASEADQQNWDASVKELLAFPPVLQSMSSNLSWTSELGDADYNQPNDVMDAIQAMRRDAKKEGQLKSNDQIKVKDKNGYISIEPKTEKEVYVPAYDPWAVYGYPIDPWPGWVGVPGVWWGGPGLSFGIGFGMGPFMGYGWGWGGWGLDWYNHSLFFHGSPYWGYGPAFFDRRGYYGGYSGFYRGGRPGFRGSRGYESGPRGGARSGAFGRYNHGGTTRGFSARGQQSVGGFHGGGFSGGGFHGSGGFHGGGGGGFHGGGGGHH